jgi:hypothetical protein
MCEGKRKEERSKRQEKRNENTDFDGDYTCYGDAWFIFHSQ